MKRLFLATIMAVIAMPMLQAADDTTNSNTESNQDIMSVSIESDNDPDQSFYFSYLAEGNNYPMSNLDYGFYFESDDSSILVIDESGIAELYGVGYCSLYLYHTSSGESASRDTSNYHYLAYVGMVDPTYVDGKMRRPVIFNEYNELLTYQYLQGNEFETEYLAIRHNSGTQLFYAYEKNNGPKTRAASDLEYTEMSYTSKLAGEYVESKFYPYGEDSGKVTDASGGTLYVYAKDTATGDESDVLTINFSVSTGVEDIAADETSEVEYYNLQGVRVANPEHGIFIRVANGKSIKVAL